MISRKWFAREKQDAVELDWPEFSVKYPDRTWQAYTRRRQYVRKGQIPVGDLEPEEQLSTFLSNKHNGVFSWRLANEWIASGQEFKSEISQSQDTARIALPTNGVAKVLPISDLHIGSWGTDHRLIEQITDEILATPDLYIMLVGDLVQMAIRLRGVLEISDNILPPLMQHRYLHSWLTDLQNRILLAGWDNHAVVRQEEAIGMSPIAELLKDKIVYFSGIGHADVLVGDQVYKIAMSHAFRGSSELNPVYGPQKYLRDQGTDRDIAVAGDSHVPGLMKYFVGPNPKLALNCGSTQVNSGYGKRYFSLYSYPVFPMFTLHPTKKMFTPYWSLEECLEAQG